MTNSNFGFCFCPTLQREDCSGTLCLWVADRRGDTCFAPTYYDVLREEWNAVTGRLILPRHDADRRHTLISYAESMAHDLYLMDSTIRSLEKHGQYIAADAMALWHARSFESEMELVCP